MDNLDSIRLRLKKYLAETPKDVLKKKFDEFNQASFEGVTVNEYFSRFSEQYTFFDNNFSSNLLQNFPNNSYKENFLWSDSMFLDEIVPLQENNTNTESATDENYTSAGERTYAMAA